MLNNIDSLAWPVAVIIIAIVFFWMFKNFENFARNFDELLDNFSQKTVMNLQIFRHERLTKY